MLYNPKWDKPSHIAMLLFCESKPADEAYVFVDPRYCACAQFSHSLGMEGSAWWYSHDDDNMKTWRQLNWVAYERPRTFGALAARLRLTTN